ncbi:hypothetical protein AGDE_04145 [Angomonas deanei]|uniref:PSP1 C-terminal conserved region containing protein, putative n=1 Tax=Angomonas deanei TaxID=59799 RepID=S9UA03_9TRYP|nr:hypothetical protein AGDE_11702 [Angomonas deanei]EPY39783.1 hypothetical protein AGDE_04145 [Angomonas deanei]CAD2222863.1 PSP1 C-terminal conserved region containing protein, putative [Angomonas deanei]|eukprot:EPY25778.1 hypothetical protein AGDE_11702 [Angomonas deanei]
MTSTALMNEIDETQRVIDRWYQQTSANLQMNYSSFLTQLRQLEERITGESSTIGFSQQQGDVLMTPSRTGNEDRLLSTPPMSSPPVNRAANFTAGEATRGLFPNPELEGEMRKRPDPKSVVAENSPPQDKNVSCQVLVEFKRKRILQYESPCYVAPGEFVVVGGDRGEDIGLVTHTWVGKELPEDKSWVEGVGKVLRIASVLEVTQLQGVQTELESRAVEVAQEKVQEHALPMRIVDAEYQFDRRKLTFYYQSQHRLDFRNLVRDLYKTFRARIWMEPDTSV